MRTSSPARVALQWVLTFLAVTASFEAMGDCDKAEYRQFDFWIGEWEVRTPDGKLAGENRIERAHGGCVLTENYTTPRGYTGSSLNIYDASRRVWHQTWMDTDGTLLLLEGGLRDGKMVLEGRSTVEGKTTQHRITWTPGPDGSVRQLWESREGEGVWSVAFDGRYTRK